MLPKNLASSISSSVRLDYQKLKEKKILFSFNLAGIKWNILYIPSSKPRSDFQVVCFPQNSAPCLKYLIPKDVQVSHSVDVEDSIHLGSDALLKSC